MLKKKITLLEVDFPTVNLAFSKEPDEDVQEIFKGLDVEVRTEDTFVVSHEDDSVVKSFLSLLRKNKIKFEEDTFPIEV